MSQKRHKTVFRMSSYRPFSPKEKMQNQRSHAPEELGLKLAGGI